MQVVWRRTPGLIFPGKCPGTELDSYILMPDHIHGIIHLGTDPVITELATLGTMVKWFKTMTTNRYIRGVKEAGWPQYDKYFWQQNYYDRILRNESELESRRQYIESNPARWIESRAR
jgi:REP element-mobilizing transposase RayT